MCFILKCVLPHIFSPAYGPWFCLLQDKKSLKLGPEDNLHLEGFALSVFGKADKQDRAGRADLYDFFSSLILHLVIRGELMPLRGLQLHIYLRDCGSVVLGARLS